MGVHYDASRSKYVVRWQDGGRRKTRRFDSEREAVAFAQTVAIRPPGRPASIFPGPAPDGETTGRVAARQARTRVGSALEALAQRAPLPVEIAATPEARLPEAVEAATYFVVAEAITNVARYAHASHARVAITRDGDGILVEVADDGVGGADPSTGSGLRRLADRVAALDGRLEVDSPPGRGTAVRAVIPRLPERAPSSPALPATIAIRGTRTGAETSAT